MTKCKKRWKLAQTSEKVWWEKQIEVRDFNYYRYFAGCLTEELQGIAPVTSDMRILEIGPGPCGIITYITSNHKFAIDPLEQFYSKAKRCSEIRDPRVKYTSGQGEFLPFIENSFDFLIVDNVLDHCEDIDLFFREMERVLVSGGVIYLRNFTHTTWGIVLGWLLEIFKIDRGHPYCFRESNLHRLFHVNKFDILRCTRRGFVNHFFTLLSARKFSYYLRAFSFSQADKVLFILRNRK